MGDRNATTYATAKTVDYYTQLQQLQPAEATIIERLRTQLPTMKMLDIGIGAGRTTKHFASLVATYTGIDYSPQMIAACQQRFKDSRQPMTLQVGDARAMAEFADQSFDFILFSFNGIDSVSHGDRLKIFQEIKRISKTGCYFLFSSHNLQAMEREFDWKQKISCNPISTYIDLVMLTILKSLNRSINRQKLADSDYLIIRDESHNFSLQNYYIRPAEQCRQLADEFENIEIYSWQSGLQISDPQELAEHPDLWLYYLCQSK
jgi:ubiquinone/menaquinone biosynthesis C-methylase UbiE